MKNKVKIEDTPNYMTAFFKGTYEGHSFLISDTIDGIFVTFDGVWGKSNYEHRAAIDEIVRKYRKKKEKLFKF